MVDVVSQERRSEMMSKIKSKDTTIEIIVRKWLFSKGYRYRKNDPHLPGKPDIVLPKYKSVIFVHGCFWHGHIGCKRSGIPKSRTEYWTEKINNNKVRDDKNQQALRDLGWKVIIIRECEIEDNATERLNKLILDLQMDECKSGNHQ